MPYKCTIQALQAGEYFYFPNDPQLTAWKKTKEKRIAGAKQIFWYCENNSGKVEDFNGDRNVMSFYSDEEVNPLPPVYKKHIPVLIPATIKKHSYTNNFTNMHHHVSTVKIYETTNYQLFDKLKGNRKINDAKIKRIIKEIDAGNDMLQYYPIQVQEQDEKLNILDGQHRFTISKILKRPVYYMLVTEKKSMPEIAKVNSNVEKWKSSDYINCYIAAGNDNYIQMNEFYTKFGFSIGLCLHLLYSGKPGAANGEAKGLHFSFQNGTFEVAEHKKACELAELCSRFSFFPNWRSRDFVIAVYKIIEAGKVSIQDILTAVQANSNMLTQQANHKEYIYKIEQIINIGKKNRIVIA